MAVTLTKNKYETAARLAAVNEKCCSAESISQEIEPLIRDYFYADVCAAGNTVTVKLFNGQTFKITTEEIKS